MSMQREDYERLAKVETELGALKQLMIEMNAKLDTYSANFVPRNELKEMFRSRDEQIREIKATAQTNKALLPAWGAVAVSVISTIATVVLASN